jgi:hypothetical protein
MLHVGGDKDHVHHIRVEGDMRCPWCWWEEEVPKVGELDCDIVSYDTYECPECEFRFALLDEGKVGRGENMKWEYFEVEAVVTADDGCTKLKRKFFSAGTVKDFRRFLDEIESQVDQLVEGQ